MKDKNLTKKDRELMQEVDEVQAHNKGNRLKNILFGALVAIPLTFTSYLILDDMYHIARHFFKTDRTIDSFINLYIHPNAITEFSPPPRYLENVPATVLGETRTDSTYSLDVILDDETRLGVTVLDFGRRDKTDSLDRKIEAGSRILFPLKHFEREYDVIARTVNEIIVLR